MSSSMCALCLSVAGIAGSAWVVSSRPEAAVPSSRVIPVEPSRIAPLIERFERLGFTTSDSPWTIYHALLGNARDIVLTGPGAAGSINASAWILEHASWRPDAYGVPLLGPPGPTIAFAQAPSALQGRVLDSHFCHALACLLDAGIEVRAVVRVPPNGEPRSLADLVAGAQAECHTRSDLSWALPAFLKAGAAERWTNRFGEHTSLDALAQRHVRQEAASPACYGTHWRMALAVCAVEGEGTLSAGTRRLVKQRLRLALDEARSRTDAFGRLVPEHHHQEADPLTYAAHTVEWVCVAMEEHEFHAQQWVHTAVLRLVEDLELRRPSIDVEAHAVAALRRYRDRCGGSPEALARR